MKHSGRRLLYLITEDWFFRSHFLDRARAARAKGYNITVAARDNGELAMLRAEGFATIAIDFHRRGINLLHEARTLRAIIGAYRQVRPDIVHHVAFKPILYGTLAARLSGCRKIINAPVGMGFVFTSKRPLALLLRPLISVALRFLLNPEGSTVVCENSEDAEEFVRRGWLRRIDMRLIEGAGINLEAFPPNAEPSGPPVVVLVARMLWDKGVGDFVEAARILARRGVAARFQLVGEPDLGNPSSIDYRTLELWRREGVVELLGHRRDIPAVLSNAHIVCLPSYGEGLPKSLLEAMAAGRPIVATDVLGCRTAVSHEENGLLVPPRDPKLLAVALERLILSRQLRRRFGAAGRERAKNLFASPIIIGQTLALYESLSHKDPLDDHPSDRDG